MIRFFLLIATSIAFISTANAGKAHDMNQARKERAKEAKADAKEAKSKAKEAKAEAKAQAKGESGTEMNNNGKAGKNVRSQKNNVSEPATKTLPEEIEKSDAEMEGSGDEGMD